MEKLLIIGSNSVHIYNYIDLIRPFFKEIFLITDTENKRFNYGHIKIRYTCFSLRKPISFLKSIFFIKKVISDFKPCLIHSHQLTTNAYLTLLANRKEKIPAVYTAWGSDVLLIPQMSLPYRMMNLHILKKAQWFTADAHYMADIMQKTAGKKLNILIANFGIEIPPPVSQAKQNIIYSNRQLKKLYRIDKIIEVFARFVKKEAFSEWKLIIGAEGEEKPALMLLADSLGLASNVEFVGWLDKEKNMHYYSIAKYYISIPESDGTSISLLEAMACGCLPILSDLPANKEWVQHKTNGYIANDLNHNFIEEALKIDIKKAAALNRVIINERGSKQTNAHKFLQFYKDILNQTHD